jgi:aspartyl-tRNA(Asn)/glutamyl-tRNA(Gln) amidotransferase subunit B
MPLLQNEVSGKFMNEHDLTSYQARALTSSREIADYFEDAVRNSDRKIAQLCANWISGNLSARLNEEDLDITQSRVGALQLRRLAERISDGTISGKIAKEVFDTMWAGEGSVDEIIERRGLKQISDSGAIEKIVDEVLAANAQQVADYRAGKDKAFNSLVGQVMKASKGKANPTQVNTILKQKLA